MGPDRSVEEWRSVPGWPYVVSSQGRVRRTPPARQSRNPEGLLRPHLVGAYRKVTLFDGGRAWAVGVARLMCIVFYGPPPSPAHQAAHRDGEPENNILENLYWATPQQNRDDCRRHGRIPMGLAHPCTKLHPDQVREIRERDPSESYGRLAERYGVSKTRIAQLVREGRLSAP